MAFTKKLLVPFDPAKPSWNPNDWLLPVVVDGQVMLQSVKAGKTFEYGRVVFIGEPVTENDLFAKLVDTGRKVPSVEETLATLRGFLEAMKTVKIGNVVTVAASADGVTLNVASNTPSGFGK